MLRWIVLVVPVLWALGGCVATTGGPDLQEERVVKWAGEYLLEYDYRRPPPRGTPTYAQWVSEGRSLDDAADVLARLIERGDGRLPKAQFAYALGAIGSAQQQDVLIACLSSNEGALLRMIAAASLGRIGDQSAVTALGKTLAKDSDVNVRANAAGALGIIGGQDAVRSLERAQLQETNPFVLECIRRTLTRAERGGSPGNQRTP